MRGAGGARRRRAGEQRVEQVGERDAGVAVVAHPDLAVERRMARRMSILRSDRAKLVSDRMTPSSSRPSDPSTSEVIAASPAAPM